MHRRTATGCRALGNALTAGLCSLMLAEGLPRSAAAQETGEPVALADRYEVTGVTIDDETGFHRQISGRIHMRQKGDTYTTRFELSTLYPGSHAAGAKVVGQGEGTIEGRTLTGTAETQLFKSNVPGIDIDFGYMPREFAARLRSTSTATLLDDGSLRVEIENQAVEGSDYAPTRTILVGHPSPPPRKAGDD